MKVVLALLVVSVAVAVNSFPFLDHDYERTALGDSIDKASFKLLKEAYTAGTDKNVIASPLGVLLLLSLYSAGAGPSSRQEISTLLGGSDYKKTSEDYIGLSHVFANMDPDYLTLANKIYVDKEYTVDEKFAGVARDYKSDVASIDFKKPSEAASIINQWNNLDKARGCEDKDVSDCTYMTCVTRDKSDEKTRGNIKSPVSPDAITPDTVAGLFNVIFFKGHWHVPFEASQTKDEDFHVNKQTTVKKPTMHLKQSLFYAESEELGAKMIELPYKEKGFRMVVVLPNEIDGLSSVIEKASQKGLLEDVIKLSPSGRDVDLQIPKFEIQTKLDLNELLPKVGIEKIFVEGADKIVNSSTVVVSKAFQEAFVKVDEEGATAGAFTGSFMVDRIMLEEPEPPIDFKVDHPFLFLILYQDKLLFSGTYTQ